MAWVAVDKNSREWVYHFEPIRDDESKMFVGKEHEPIRLPIGSIEKLIGKKLTWNDEPVELKEKEENQSEWNDISVPYIAQITDIEVKFENGKVMDYNDSPWPRLKVTHWRVKK
jgi:hypothetical protein